MRRDPDAADRVLIAAKACRTIRICFAHAAGLSAGYDLDRDIGLPWRRRLPRRIDARSA